jgi:hypothetical protein
MSDRKGNNKVIIALLREAQLQLMLLNVEQPSANFRRAIDTLDEAIRTLQLQQR